MCNHFNVVKLANHKERSTSYGTVQTQIYLMFSELAAGASSDGHCTSTTDNSPKVVTEEKENISFLSENMLNIPHEVDISVR